MSTLAIEINDAGLLVASELSVLATEPGYALIDRKRTVTGHEAYGQSRLQPGRVTNRYWSRLSTKSEQPGWPSNAALAFAQLEKLWAEFGSAQDDAIFVVPASFGADELGLLLGIAEECRIPVRAMIDSAVAATFSPHPAAELIHADAGLHGVFATTLDQGDKVSVRTRQSIETAGIASLADAIARRIAESFVFSTRFDPFHHAGSEQALYNCLPGWLETLQSEESISISLEHDGETFSTEIGREHIMHVTAGFNRALVQLIAQCRESEQSLVVQVSDRLYGVPGLTGELARLDDSRLIALPEGQAARGALRRLDFIDRREDGVRLLRHAPWLEEAAAEQPRKPEPASAPARASRSPATHVVYAGVAYRLDRGGIIVGNARANGHRTIVIDGGASGISGSHFEIGFRDGELRLKDLSRYGTFVNERRVAGETTLHPADVIRIGSPGAELQVVIVEESDAT